MLINLVLGLLFSLTALPAFSQGKQLQPAAFRDFSGGYVDSVDPLNLDPKFSPDLLNVDVDNPVGSLKPRAGYLGCGVTPSTTTTTNAFVYSRVDGSENLILTDNNSVWSTRDCVTFSTITTGLGYNNIPNFATVRNKLWIVNGSTWPIVWDGATATPLDGRASTPSPQPPKARYIAFWKERVWLARTNTDPSGVWFSALEDSAGNDLDPSTGTASWPAINAIYVDQDAGSPIYGIYPYCDQLKTFKENGRWGINFNSQFDNSVVKDFAYPGTRYQSSIVEHDGLLHFVGQDGIYASDCNQATRISDSFESKFSAITQSNVDSSFKTWDTDSDFNAGTTSSATIAGGSVFISSRTGEIQNFESGLGSWVCITDTGDVNYDCGVFNSTGAIGGIDPIGTFSARLTGSGASNAGTLYVVKSVDGSTVTTSVLSNASLATHTVDASAYAGQVVFLHFTAASAKHLYSSTFTIGNTLTFQYSNNASQAIILLDNFQSRFYHSTGTWTSEIYNMVSVSSYSTFEAEHTLNSGNIAYFIRVGTDTTAITQNAFMSITPGALITGTTSEIYVQVKASMTAPSSLDASPELDLITVNVVQGAGSNQQIFSFSHDGNYYVSAATGTSASNNIVFKKSRKPLDSWTLYDWKIGPMVEFNNHFYAAGSSAPWVARMKYGTNDNGQAINWYWTSKDEAWGNPGVRKYLLEITGDYRSGNASNLSVGFSRDAGTSFTSATTAASGSRGTFRRFVNGGNSSDYRLRVGGSTLDETVIITGLAGWARILNLRE